MVRLTHRNCIARRSTFGSVAGGIGVQSVRLLRQPESPFGRKKSLSPYRCVTQERARVSVMEPLIDGARPRALVERDCVDTDPERAARL